MMDKNYEDNPEIAKYLKERLVGKYKEIFEKYEMGEQELSQAQVCNLAEFLSKEYPDKTRMNDKESEELQKIFVVIDKQNKRAIMINTNETEKMSEGELGVYNLEQHQFQLTNEQMRKIIREHIKKYAKATMTPQEEEEMIDQIAPKNLEELEQTAAIGLDEEEVDRRARELIDHKIDEKNEENGKTKEEREAIESQVKEEEQITVGEKDEPAKNQTIPEDVAQACGRLGITNIKAFMYAKGTEFVAKTDIPYVKKDAGNVLIIRTADTGKSTDKYYVFQNGRLCVPGNRDDEIDQVARRATQGSKNGRLIQPLEIDDEEQYVEYSDSQGLVIREKLEENMGLSTKDLEGYKREIQEELEKYSDELYKIEQTPFLSDTEKDKLYIQSNEKFNRNNEKMAVKHGINIEDVKAINLETDERTQEQVDKEQEDDEFDERGRPIPPGRIR